MGTRNYQKIIVPDVDEDLLVSLEAMADSTVSVTSCASAAEAENPVPPEPGNEPSAVIDDHLRAAIQAMIDDGRISVKGTSE